MSRLVTSVPLSCPRKSARASKCVSALRLVRGLSIRFFLAHSAISLVKVVSLASLRMPSILNVGTRGCSGPGASISTTGTNLPVLAPLDHRLELLHMGPSQRCRLVFFYLPNGSAEYL